MQQNHCSMFIVRNWILMTKLCAQMSTRAQRQAGATSGSSNENYCAQERMSVKTCGISDMCRLWRAVDRMASVRHGTGFDTAEDALTRAREDAAQRGESRIITSSEQGFHDCFHESMRNPRVPIAAVSPASGIDWSGQCAPQISASCTSPNSHVTESVAALHICPCRPKSPYHSIVRVCLVSWFKLSRDLQGVSLADGHGLCGLISLWDQRCCIQYIRS